MRSTTGQRKTVLLAGNPNVGKSTLFNALTGLRQHTGNWSGKTVEVASGLLRPEKDVVMVDLPGMYSLHGNSEDEQVAAAHLTSGEGDCVVVVCDGCCLERNLILALQIMEYCHNVVLCVNLMDEAHRKGLQIDHKALEKGLGIPVVFTSGAKKKGLRNLKDCIRQALAEPKQAPACITDSVQQAKHLVKASVTKIPGLDENWRLVMDRQLTSPRRGFGILALLLLLVLWITVWGANYPSIALEWCFAQFYDLLSPIKAVLPSWLSGIILDGIYATASQVISVMLPPLLIFFPLFTLLEDVGYLPRLAFLLERGMYRCGGCGKQALTLCMGLGCNAVGVTGCRIISSPRQRLAAILTNAMVPCNGRFPALIVLGTLFLGDALGALAVAGCVVLGVIGAMVCTDLLNRSVLRDYPHEEGFLMEIPPLRRPQLKNILVRSWLDRSIHVAGRALMVAAPAGAVLWLLQNTACLAWLCNLLAPLGKVLGMNGEILASFILSLPANELFLPVLLMTLGGVSEGMLQTSGITWQMAVCTMVFMLFHWPCATTLLTVRKETGTLKKTAAAALLPTAVGIVLCLMLNLIL